ncbi:MAG: sulfurtransferase FdhD [Rhodoferax sp.]|nr:MAG: sulfurtransferase FdhD [Rhodoferax sp.]
MKAPRMTQARVPLTHTVQVLDETGALRSLDIPAERALTLYVDKRELVTLMTLGAHPEWMSLGYLLNQRLIAHADDVESITVDWEVGAAGIRTRHGIADLAVRTASRVVTTGCGQGSVFGSLMDGIANLALPPTRVNADTLHAITDTIRLQDSIYKQSGSVHGCALFSADKLQLFVEDVGRHNAIDTIAGWMALQPQPLQNGILYTTGRLTSEMVIKAATMGIAVVVSRSGITQMGLSVANSLGLCAIGRAVHRRFLCYAGFERLQVGAAAVATPAAV